MTEDKQGGSEQAERGERVRVEGVSMEPPGFLKRLFSVPKNVRKTAAAGDVVVPVIGARDGWGGIRQARKKVFFCVFQFQRFAFNVLRFGRSVCCVASLFCCLFGVVLLVRSGSIVVPSGDIFLLARFGSIKRGIARHDDGGDCSVGLVVGGGVGDDVGTYWFSVDVGVGIVHLLLTNAIFSHAGVRGRGANLRRCYDTYMLVLFFFIPCV